MKLLCVIDHLGSGGAQRQMSLLTVALARRGHQVELFVYFPRHDFFAAGVRESGVRIHEFHKGAGFSFRALLALRALLANGGYDAVLSFLDTPNVYAELARLVSGMRVPLVVSERSSYLAEVSPLRSSPKRLLYALATQVVTNNLTQRDWLRRKFWLRDKVTCIYNGIDLATYARCEPRRESSDGLRLIGIGRVTPLKNIDGLISALAHLGAAGQALPRVSWVGRDEESDAGRKYRARLDAMFRQHPQIASRWSWLGERRDVPALLGEHDALIHPAYFEGLPNVVCEAFSTGRPALLSAVCDHPHLTGNDERGMLFDPARPPEIAATIQRFAELSTDRRAAMMHAAREFAEANLGIDVMAAAYERLLARLAHDKRIPT